LRQIPGIDLIVGAQYKMNLPDYLPARDTLRKQPAPELLHTRTIDREDFVMPGVGDYTSVRANLKIQDGCNFMCSFCIIPFARGHERSRQFEDVIREAEALAARGHRELVLTGVNIGRYEDHGRSLVELIMRLETIAGVDRIRISSIEPTTVTHDLLDYMATSRKLCRYLHIPLQSGDDGILHAMNRHYTVKDYTALIERAIARVPDLGLGTDLLVGFPGEGEPQFANTQALARALPFAYFHVFGFSKRPGTAADRIKPVLHPSTIKARCRTLSTLSRSKRLAFAQGYTGRTLDVLFEGQDNGLWTGFTHNYLRVGVSSRCQLRNDVRTVTITGAMDELAVGECMA
jgi:threonylcarbamoyladenosine tRNA methylthiotransferase MtaB